MAVDGRGEEGYDADEMGQEQEAAELLPEPLGGHVPGICHGWQCEA